MDLPNLDTLEGVKLALAFLVPGLIATYIRTQFTTGRMASHTEAALSYLVLSILYYALVLPFVDIAMSIKEPGYVKATVWFSLVFIGPAIFGLALGVSIQKDWIRNLLKYARLHPVHAVPSAWDWKFNNITEQWVLVVLKDGKKFAGLYGLKSFASSDPTERDLYLQKICDIDDQNNWHPRENGALIAGGEIQSIEFWPYRNGEKNE